MGMFDKPTPPDPTAVSNQQLDYNQQAATAQQQTNMVDQKTPFGSLNYSQTGTNPDGTPKFTANTSLSPEMQALLNQLTATRGTAGQIAGSELNSASDMLSHPIDLSNTAVTNQIMGEGRQYLQPIFDQQQNKLDARLRNSGIAAGSTAFDNAQNLQSRNVNDAYTNLLMTARPEAISELTAPRNQTISEVSAMMGAGAPTMPTFQNTPTAQIQPPNYTGLTQTNYQQQLAQQQAMLNGVFGIGSAVGGGWARAGFPLLV
jgi:hypothetical protein